MENASKALIIAGAILLAILIIGLGVFIYNQASNTVGNAGNMDQLEIARFNEQFEPFLHKEISGLNAITLIKTIDASNELEDIKVDSRGAKQSEVKKAHSYTTDVTYENGLITKIYIMDEDDGILLGDNEDGGGGVIIDPINPPISIQPMMVNSRFIPYLGDVDSVAIERLIRAIDDWNEEFYNTNFTTGAVGAVTYLGPRIDQLDENVSYRAEANIDEDSYQDIFITEIRVIAYR